MKKKCAHCFSRLDPKNFVCPVCGIDSTKNKEALTMPEKKIAYRCRTLYTIGFLMIVSGLMEFFLFLPIMYYYQSKYKGRNLTSSHDFFPFYAQSMLILILLTPIFGFLLRRYLKCCYVGGIALYFSMILVNIPGIHIFPIILSLFFLYYIVSPPSRQIFYR